MPLMDHFRPPASIRAPWTSLNTSWVGKVMAELNRTLPADRYVALGKSHLGPEVEADVAEIETRGDWPPTDTAGGLAVAPPIVTVENDVTEEFEVEVQDLKEGMALVGVIEFISPGNKDRPETRRRLVSKVKSYLNLGIGVVIVDVVTVRLANLHNELVEELRRPAAAMPDTATYLAGYRPVRTEERLTTNMWPYAVTVGSPLPSVPLALKNGPIIAIDFEKTYTQALADHRL
jgi:hypothetical protein